MSSPHLSDIPPLSRNDDHTDIKVYKRRFLVCIAFGINSIMNQMLWITFAPIQSKAAEYYNVSQNAINIYSLVFMICYVPGTIICANMFKSFGLENLSVLLLSSINRCSIALFRHIINYQQ